MSQGAVLTLESGAKLPRGRHGIPRELIAANQRERLLGATTALFAERGFASLSVTDVTDRAHVSRATFYVLFEDKLDCVLAAQRRAFDALQRAIEGACASCPRWPQGVVAAIGAALDFAGQFPAEARLVLASSQVSSEPRLLRDGLAANQRLLDLLRRGAQSCPSARSPAALSEQATLCAAMSIVGICLATDDLEALPELELDLVQIVLTPYIGGDQAKRVALAA